MKKTIKTVDDFGLYLAYVLQEAQHHTKVENTVLILAGLVVIHKDANSSIQAYTVEGETKKVAWAKLKGNYYAFSYNHETDYIEMRKDSWQGDTVLKLNDSMNTIAAFESYFGIVRR